MVRLSDSIRWIARENSNPIDIHLSTFVDGEYTRTLVAATKGMSTAVGLSNVPQIFKGSLVDWITYLSNNSILQDANDL